MIKKNKIILISSTIVFSLILVLLFFFLNKKEEVVTYRITFNSNGGSIVKDQLINQGELAKKPVDPTKEGYTFVEWQYNNKTFNFATKIERDITLIAKWQEVNGKVEMITIKFETDGGSTISNQIIQKGEKATIPEEPTKEGYTFKGWAIEGAEGTIINFKNKSLSKDTVFVAVFE